MEYAAAVAGVAAATLLRMPFESLLEGRAPFVLYVLPILASAWFLGVGPTVVSVVLSVVAVWYFVFPPQASFALHDPGSFSAMTLFLIVAAAMVWLARAAAHTRRVTAEALQAATGELAVRKQAERALADQRERFRVTLGSIGDAVITTDRECRVTFMNGVAEQLTGWPLRVAAGKRLAEVLSVINEESRKRVADPCEKVLRTGAVMGMTNHNALLARDGTERPIAESAAPIIDGDKSIQGVVVVFRDVSAQRRREQEHQAAERDREQLLNSERAARTEAERATRLKDEFVATLSHELRTPLNAILGWTQVLRRGRSSDPAAVARGLEVIERNTRLQAQLISDLLDVSRIVSGKLRLELELVDLPAVIEAAAETVREAAEIKKVKIERVLDPGVPTLVGRSRPPAADRLEPALERHQVHARGRPGEGDPRPPGRGRGGHREGQRHRHQPRVRALPVRPLPPGRQQLHHPAIRRPGAGAGHRQAADRAAQRGGQRRERGRRPGRHVHRSPAAGGGARGGRCPPSRPATTTTPPPRAPAWTA